MEYDLASPTGDSGAKATELASADFFVTGGTLPVSARSYIPRAADDQLEEALRRGELCYVLNARQMGKSSLCIRARARLEAAGVRTAFLDLQKFGSSATAEQWYRSLLERLGYDLKLRAPMLAYWRDNAGRAPLDRLFGALTDVALAQIPGPVIVFLDEIDVVRDLGFKTDEFFAAIRQCFNARAEDPAMGRLTFCVLGTVAPTDLIRDVRLSPFNVGTRVRLADFTPEEAAPLAAPLPGGSATLSRVLWWTSGHPYLTQRLCAELTKADSRDADAMAARLFFARADADVDENVKNVRNGLLRTGGGDAGFDRTDLLLRYEKVAAGKRVPDDDTDPICTALRLSGIVRSEGGLLKSRNRIYARLFDRAWVRNHLPDAELRRQRAAVAKARWQIGSVAAAVLAVLAVLTGWALNSAAIAARREQEANVAQQREARSAEAERIAKESALRDRAAALRATGVARSEETRANAEAEKAKAALRRESVALAQARANERAAQDQTRRADREARRAAAESRIARLNAESANRNAETANRLNYISKINLCQRAIEANDYARASAILEETRAFALRDNEGEYPYEWEYLYELCHLERRYFFHGHSVGSVALSHDGKRALTGSSDRIARIWDVQSGKVLHRFEGHSRKVASVAFSRDGNQVLTGDESGAVYLWDLKSGKMRLLLKGHTDADAFYRRSDTNSVAFSPDDKRVIAGGYDFTARIWDVATGKQLLQLGQTNAQQVSSVAFSPDGKKVLTGHHSGALRLWDSQTGKLRSEVRARGMVESVAFSADGLFILSAGNSLQVWNVSSCTLVSEMESGTDYYNSAKFAPDGRSIISVHDGGGFWETRPSGGIQLWDIKTRKEVQRLVGHTDRIRSVDISPDGRYVLTGSEDHTARLWDVEHTRKQLLIEEHGGSWVPVAFSPDGKQVVTSSKNNTACLLDARTGRVQKRLIGHTDSVLAVAFSPDDKLVVTGSNDNTAILWDVQTGHQLLNFKGHKKSLESVVFSPNGKQVLTGGADGTVRLWDVHTGRQLRSIAFPLRPVTNVYNVYSALFSPDGKHILAFGLDGGIWHTQTGKRTRDNWTSMTSVATTVSPDGKKILHTGANSAYLRDIQSGRELVRFNGHSGFVTAVAFSPDGKRALTGSYDATVRVWDVQTGRELLLLKGHTQVVTSVAFSPDGKRVLTGSRDQSARIWRKATDVQIAEISRQKELQRRLSSLLTKGEATLLSDQRKLAADAFTFLSEEFPHTIDGPWGGFRVVSLIHDDRNAYRNTCQEQIKRVSSSFSPDMAALVARRAALAAGLLADYGPAIRLAERAVATKPENAMYLYSLGAIELRAGRVAGAIKHLERAAKQDPNLVWPKLFLAIGHARVGDRRAAERWLAESEAFRRDRMDAVFPGPENWFPRLCALLLRREAIEEINSLPAALPANTGSRGN